jgi:hypothetical protein
MAVPRRWVARALRGSALVLGQQRRDKVLGAPSSHDANFKINFDFRGENTTLFAVPTRRLGSPHGGLSRPISDTLVTKSLQNTTVHFAA